MLSGMSKDQLLQFIKRKGNDRKTAMHESVSFQTRDYSSGKTSLQSLQANRSTMEAQQAEWEASLQTKRDEADAERATVNELLNEMANKQRELE